MPQSGRLRISKLNYDSLADIKESQKLDRKLVDLMGDGNQSEDNDFKVDYQSDAAEA